MDGHPRRWVDLHWADFTRGYPVDHQGQLRFTGSLGTDRYLQWRVAVVQFRKHPLVGIGSDNYAVPYTLMRNTDYIDARYPHSTPLRLLSQLGLIGTGMFVAAIALATILALRRRKRLDATGGGVVGVCLTIFGYWLLHGSIDWFGDRAVEQPVSDKMSQTPTTPPPVASRRFGRVKARMVASAIAATNMPVPIRPS